MNPAGNTKYCMNIRYRPYTKEIIMIKAESSELECYFCE